ncbi:Caprin-1 [Clonorchis sinensis]|uniref:Caprin-1 n=1 Tax=Clonorchis sinensis TaxID=79923 RepID=A0A8T1M9B1_CLOSI|nr:Caprin-1 [Clonorchis sinensis]
MMSDLTRSVDVVKQFVANFERKQRNLMKRKSKLDTYRDLLNRGETLNEEQKKAVESYEGVLQSLNVVHEVLSQSKDLVSDVERCCKAEELQKEVEHERYTLSFLHTHVCLMRFLTSLDQQEVRVAVARASSENSLRMLDTVRHVLLPSITDWPSTGSTAFSAISSFLQTNPEVTSAAEHTFNFVLGRPAPIPVPGDYDGPHKKFNFKEARNLCFRLLAAPAVRRSIEFSCGSEPTMSQAREEVTQLAGEPLKPPNEMFQPNPEFLGHNGELHVPDDEVIPAEIQTCGSRRFDTASAPNILDQVIKPLGGTFNFLQASSVLTSDPLVEISVPGTDVPASHELNPTIPDAIANHIAPSNGCYAPPSPPAAPEILYNAEPKSELNEITESSARESATMRQVGRNPVAVEPDVPPQTKPISYADLVRRSGYNRPAHQQDHYLSGSSQEVHKAEHVVSESHTVYDSGDAEPGPSAPNWNRGSRGFYRGFSRGNPGPRRAVGGVRWNRIGAGAGRGGGGAYRGAPPSVAQPSY